MAKVLLQLKPECENINIILKMFFCLHYLRLSTVLFSKVTPDSGLILLKTMNNQYCFHQHWHKLFIVCHEWYGNVLSALKVDLYVLFH